ncbi:MAG: hypothetical protein LQ337_004714 [Flavoplaca oasis]|nr:MAG: hypothetical protein LQ337_004714 [Flavoplaca oasis]
MLWGHLSCLICDESINRNGSLTCQCTPTTLYRNLPVAPITSQERLSSNPASKDPQSLDEKEFTTDLIRCNKEKLAYDQALDLDEEIKTVYEDQGDFHIGDKSIAPMGSGSEDVELCSCFPDTAASLGDRISRMLGPKYLQTFGEAYLTAGEKDADNKQQ